MTENRPAINYKDPLECLLAAIAEVDNDPDYLDTNFPHSQISEPPKKQIRTLRTRISLIASTIEAIKLTIKLEATPSFLKLNQQKLLKNKKTKRNLICQQVRQISQLYLDHLNELHTTSIQKLAPLLPNNWSKPDSVKFNRTNHKEWNNIREQQRKPKLPTRSDNSYKNKKTLSFHRQPLFWSPSLEKQKNAILNQNEPIPDPLELLTYADKAKLFRIRKLNNNVFQIEKIDKHIIIPREVLEVLTLGLNFVPTYNDYPLEQLDLSLQDFEHRLRWKFFWENKKNNKPNAGLDILPAKLRQNRPKQDPPAQSKLTKYCQNIRTSIMGKLQNNPSRLSAIDRQAALKINKSIKFLRRHREELIVKPADKGSSIVIMDKHFYQLSMENYIEESKNHFRKIETDPTSNLLSFVNKRLDFLTSQGFLDKNTRRFIQPPVVGTRCPSLYGLPKIHKPIISCRPIVSGNNHPTENISIFIDYVLQPLVPESPLFLKDSTQLLNDLNLQINTKPFPKNALLFNLDVVGMYTNIPLGEACDSVSSCMKAHPEKLNNRNNGNYYSPTLITQLLRLTLFNNFFQFNNEFFHQVHGIAMGTPCACVVSDIFICQLMEKILDTHPDKPLFFRQYRDDGLGIWSLGKERLEDWFSYLNSQHPTIKFTLNYGSSINYLDLKLSIDEFGYIKSETFYKETETFNFLHQASNHPSHCGINIAKSQAIRHIRNCSTFSSFKYHLELLQHNLIKRNYCPKEIQLKANSVKYKDRATFLRYRKHEHSNNLTPLIVPYAKNMPNMKKICDTAKNSASRQEQNTLDSIIIGYKIQKSIGNQIIRAKYPDIATRTQANTSIKD